MRDDISIDETMFIIGSGPCLNDINIKLLKGLNTISLNRQYLAYEEWGFWPKYYVCIDNRLIQSIYETDIAPMMMNPECKIENFFIRACRLPCTRALNSFLYLNTWPLPPPRAYIYPEKLIQIIPDITDAWNTSLTACVVDEELSKNRNPELYFDTISGAYSVSLSYSLGYKRVVLLGMDAKYIPREKSIEAGKDLNHFHPNYFDVEEFEYGVHYGEAVGYFEPWSAMVEGAKQSGYTDEHKLAADETFEIISCSPGSVINSLFPYHDFEELLKTYEVNNEN